MHKFNPSPASQAPQMDAEELRTTSDGAERCTRSSRENLELELDPFILPQQEVAHNRENEREIEGKKKDTDTRKGHSDHDCQP